ncbi:MAG: hypothetical protein ACJ790_06105 [Myxococcaceae bacterium]
MPKISKVKIDDLVAASRKYVDAQVKKADVNGNKVLTQTEAKKLATDLQDNFSASQFKLPNGSVTAKDIAREFTVMVEAWAKASDKNGDGYLTATEAKALPQTLRDNYLDFATTQSKVADQQHVTAGTLSTHDTTPKARIAEHEKAFGKSSVSYQDAFSKALKALATDEYGVRGFVADNGGPDGTGISDQKKITAEVKKILKEGSLELVEKDEEIPTGEDNKDYWIFALHSDAGVLGDNGVWAVVDRKTGEASVETFN